MKVAATKKQQKKGYYGPYGGRYVPERLSGDLDRLEQVFERCRADRAFREKLEELRTHYVGRPTPLYFARNTTKKLGGGRLYLKMEGLSHTGAHKINNALGQGLLALQLGRKKLIAETGAGQHGLATATVAATLGLSCDIYMGANDARRQRPNVFWMETLGARVIPVHRGTKTLTDAVDAAFEAWDAEHDDAHYLVGSALGPSPYPRIVKEFQSVIGQEVKAQSRERFGGLPDILIACAGGGSNSMGLFAPFIEERSVRLIAVEGGGKGSRPGEHAVRFQGRGKKGVFQGYRSLFLHDADGLLPTHSISAGLDYAGIGPELAFLHDGGRVELTYAMDSDVLKAITFFARNEGIIPALESAHALAAALKIVPELSVEQSVVVNVSGRGDKDLFITAPEIGSRAVWADFLREEYIRLSKSL